ncbi:MAG: ATP-binding protein, partial [Sphaerospermopsis sp. SIO1G2]|nr:ATP-binding protein [Sphaerospermopsis sp. SIO1G2]
MNKKSPVPRLDLAPKLRRPLSLWNPLDYLRLLYWVFYFPQALRWYVDTFGGGYTPEQEIDWSNSLQHQLLLQGIILTIITPVLICLFLQKLGLDIDWERLPLGVVFSIAFGVVFSVAFGVVFSVAFSVVFSVAFSVVFSVVTGVTFSIVSGVALGVALGFTSTLLRGVTFGLAKAIAFCLLLSMPFGLVLSMLFSLVLNVAVDEAFGLTESVRFGVAFGLGFIFATLRLEIWLFGWYFFNLPYFRNGSFLLPRISIIPLPYLYLRLKTWLLQDWENGVHNVHQLLGYTLQFIPVIQAVNKVLKSKPPEQIIWSVSQLVHNPFNWEFIKYISDLEKPSNKKPHRAVTAGFWYLHEKQLDNAVKAFEVVRSLIYGEEMYILSLSLLALKSAEELKHIGKLQLYKFPESYLLRPFTWQTLNRFVRVIEDVNIINNSVSPISRSLALNRALGELTTIFNTADNLPKAERGLIIDIAEEWQQKLLQISGEVGEFKITKPVNNPYVIGDPVMDELFIGREDIIRQLEELWLRSYQLQSVVIYGHRRMGKTSILLNAANSLDNQVKVVYLNLLELGNVTQGVGEVLMKISDEIYKVVNISPPDDNDLLKLPYRTFNRYFAKVIKNLSGSLIIALDEFEKIEYLINVGKISPNFMGFLRSLLQKATLVDFC